MSGTIVVTLVDTSGVAGPLDPVELPVLPPVGSILWVVDKHGNSARLRVTEVHIKAIRVGADKLARTAYEMSPAIILHCVWSSIEPPTA